MPEHVDDQTAGSEGGALRAQLEAALKENAALKAEKRSGEVKKALAEKGYDPRVADTLLPQDVGPDRLEEWLSANGDLIAKAPAPPQVEQQEPPTPSQPPAAAPDPALQKFAQVTPGTAPAPDDLQKIRSASTPDEVLAFMQQHGYQGSI
jgi:hypothetical protein